MNNNIDLKRQYRIERSQVDDPCSHKVEVMTLPDIRNAIRLGWLAHLIELSPANDPIQLDLMVGEARVIVHSI